ncbi:cyclic GMP-AMP synthase DncV-like nucleotidyltransferase [Sphingomonas yabuuchiae]|uniref:cyclic GMP-AMP synthase DncV-like nucleotidyltransferase n=1 Tax=Sphingomonas yabuuchiae TaxID=172044 RepID=UPI00128E9634|nr:hypothetical protein [Sphingomonas yabuuchiae]
MQPMFNTSKQVRGFHDEKVAIVGGERTNMRTRRNSNRTRLKAGLIRDGKPKPLGSHTQGSYAMHTMVQDDNLDYDIDDGLYFKAADLVGAQGGAMSALEVRKMVCAAVQDDKFKTPPDVRTNCVRVYYDAGYHVDIPTYRRLETTNIWTNKIEYSYELAGASWRKSDAKKVTTWFNETNKDLSPEAVGEGQFRRVVRYLKMFSKSRPSWKGKNPSGFALTKLASECFVGRLNRDDDALRSTMKSIADRLVYNKSVQHPVVDEELISDGDPRPTYFMDRLNENLGHLDVLDEVDCTHEKAMKAWDKVFCTSWFSEQPPEDGDDDGEPKSPVNKSGGGTYASS